MTVQTIKVTRRRTHLQLEVLGGVNDDSLEAEGLRKRREASEARDLDRLVDLRDLR